MKDFQKCMKKMSDDGRNEALKECQENFNLQRKKEEELELRIRKKIIKKGEILFEEEIEKRVNDAKWEESTFPIKFLVVFGMLVYLFFISR